MKATYNIVQYGEGVSSVCVCVCACLFVCVAPYCGRWEVGRPRRPSAMPSLHRGRPRAVGARAMAPRGQAQAPALCPQVRVCAGLVGRRGGGCA